MENINKYKIISVLLLICGSGSAAAYVLHVIIGGILDTNYNQIADSISALTAVGAPNQDILSPLLSVYHPLYIIFCISLVSSFWKNVNKQMITGAIFLTISALVSKFGFGAFVFDGENAGMTANGSSIMGLVEKINIGTLQLFVCSVAIYFTQYKLTAE